MNLDFDQWYKELLEVDTSSNHKETLAEIELLILESSALDSRSFRLRSFWLLRHLSKLV